MDDEFQVGDTVKLKSGGPVMTVTSVGDTMLHGFQVFTVWFEKVKKFEGNFPPAALVKASPPSGMALAGSSFRS